MPRAAIRQRPAPDPHQGGGFQRASTGTPSTQEQRSAAGAHQGPAEPRARATGSTGINRHQAASESPDKKTRTVPVATERLETFFIVHADLSDRPP